jgi:hypothetical protein
MLEYRVYVIGEDDRILQRHDFLCATDDDATVWAKQLVDGHTVELWQANRRVATFEPSR